MTKTLVVVESPAKAKTIEKYLGDDYAVRASYGHIRDLPRSKLGVDPDHDFAVQYEVPEDSKRHVADLKKALKQNDDLVLATDYDREGEAIAFHVATLLGVEPADAKRVTFTEITRDAILDAFAHPRTIDLELFDAQEARRILDRLVGYKISPLLWKRVQPGLSAGRVQSVAVRLIVEREREIDAFVPVEYWSIDVRLTPEDAEQPFLARLTEVARRQARRRPRQEGAAARDRRRRRDRTPSGCAGVLPRHRRREEGAEALPGAAVHHLDAAAGGRAQARLQRPQDDDRSPSGSTRGSTCPARARSGLITYMRTDSVDDRGLGAPRDRGARPAATTARRTRWPRRAGTRPASRNAQEAHEAVRPTSVFRTPQRVAAALDRDQLRLYT